MKDFILIRKKKPSTPLQKGHVALLMNGTLYLGNYSRGVRKVRLYVNKKKLQLLLTPTDPDDPEGYVINKSSRSVYVKPALDMLNLPIKRIHLPAQLTKKGLIVDLRPLK